MKLSQAIFFLLTFITSIHALALPASFGALTEASKELFKRKGGGGGRGGGGGGGGSRGGGSSTSSGSSGSRGGSSSTGSTSGSRGSGVTPSFGSRGGSGGAFYGGGASTPYRAGSPSRTTGGISPFLLGSGIGALAFFPAGAFLYGAYAYNWPRTYTYHNDTSNMNVTHPVSCVCARYQDCGCDENSDDAYLNQVANNDTVSRVANVNGTDTLLINGTLPNGTVDAVDTGAGSSLSYGLSETSGWWVIAAGVGYTMWLM